MLERFEVWKRGLREGMVIGAGGVDLPIGY